MVTAWLMRCLFTSLILITSANSLEHTVAELGNPNPLSERADGNIILAVGESSSRLIERQTTTTFRTNISDTFTPPTTKRWTISVEAQVQISTPASSACTIQICLGSGACGAAKKIQDTWSTVSLVTLLKEYQSQTAMFLVSCDGSAYVALRSLSLPGRVTGPQPETRTLTLPPATTSAVEVSTTSSLGWTTTPEVQPTQASATQPSPAPAQPASTRIQAISLCEYNRPILVSVPENPDYLLMTESGVEYDLGLDFGHERLSFTPLNGQVLCMNVSRIAAEVGPFECTRDGFTYAALPGDTIALDCTSRSSQVPGLSSDLLDDFRFQTSGSCPSIIRQVGCQAAEDAPCSLDVYRGAFDSSTKLPRGPLRLEAVGEGWTRAYLQVVTPFRRVFLVQERGSFVDIDPDLVGPNLRIQMECDILVSLVVTVRNSCEKRVPFHAVTTVESTTLDRGMTRQFTLPLDSPYLYVDWPGPLCVTNLRSTRRSCNDGFGYFSGIGDFADQDTFELECGETDYPVTVRNDCPAENPVILSQSSEPDGVIVRSGETHSFNLRSDDAAATFTPLGGYLMCATGMNGNACSTDTFVLKNIDYQDVISLACADGPPPPQPEALRVASLNVQTGPDCPGLAVQIGCQGTYCQGFGSAGGSQDIHLKYPVLAPNARLALKVVGSNSNSIEWSVSFGEALALYDQVKPQWLEVTVPDDANEIFIRTSCTPEPQGQFSVAVYNRCMLPEAASTVLFSTPTQRLRDPWTPWQQAVFRTALDTYIDAVDPRLNLEPLNMPKICATSQVTGNTECGTSSFTLNGVVKHDSIILDCPPESVGPVTPQPEAIVRILVYGCYYNNLVVQFGSEEGNYCQGYCLQTYNNNNNQLSYPRLTPAARLRVKALDISQQEGIGAVWNVETYPYDDTLGYQYHLQQTQGQWLEIPVSANAQQIYLYNCY